MLTPSPQLARLLGAAAVLLAVCGGCFWEDDPPPDSPSSGSDAGALCGEPTPDMCEGSCVDLSSEALHCGTCGNACESDCLNGQCISCQNVNGRWDVVGGDCPVSYCVISQNLSCGGSVACFDASGESVGTGTVEVFDGSVSFSATAGSCNLDLAGDTASGPCSALVLGCTVQARRF
ncbi:MAG: hypothetical protein H6719_11305 [Sandaracinaceae bacterium]|nr:hypothetical protein [Sandaracinaceae bacterium]